VLSEAILEDPTSFENTSGKQALHVQKMKSTKQPPWSCELCLDVFEPYFLPGNINIGAACATDAFLGA
jgi:hypothetical protein